MATSSLVKPSQTAAIIIKAAYGIINADITTNIIGERMDFIPNTDQDRKLMLSDIGVNKVSELFKDIPVELMLKENLNQIKEK